MNFTVINPFYQNLLNHTSIPHISFTISRVKSQKRSQLCAPCTKPLNLYSSINLNIDQNPRFLTLKTRARNQQFTPFLATLSKNPTFVSGLCALVLAQCVKTMLNFCVEKKWNLRTLCSSGGMPSSHSAMCTALTTSVAICHGVADSLFPVCLGFSVIVMYDAIGVRRHAGMQAQVLNKIIEDLFQGHPISERKLKELLGHTPSQVFAGALLGIVVAWYCCRGCLSPI